jgi:DNA-damage-inducible protein D
MWLVGKSFKVFLSTHPLDKYTDSLYICDSMKKSKMNIEKSLVVFEEKNIRKIWHNEEWWFSVVDIVEVLTESTNPRNYWNMLKSRELENGVELYTNCVQLKLPASDGKSYATDCTNTEGAFRIIQSIPSKKAEPLKLWLAKIGYQRVQEIENPELAQNRAKKYYELKDYPREWIDKRLRGIAIRQELTEEWKNRGVEENKDFAILTNEISKATFNVSVKQHKQIKNLDPKYQNQNLRDNMTDLELIFSMLSEKLSTEATRKDDSQGFQENKDSAKKGGAVAGRARKDAEQTFGIKVVSSKNHLDLKAKKKVKKLE